MLISIHLGNMNQGLKSQLTKIFLLPQWEEDQLGTSRVLGPAGPWEPEREQETSFGGRSTGRQSQRNRVLINQDEGLCERLSKKLPRTSEVFHYDLFELRNSKLYFRDKSTPLTSKKGV